MFTKYIKFNKLAKFMLAGVILTIIISCNFSCIERYYLDTQIKAQDKIVVDALITDQNEIQQIKLSKASSPEEYGVIPLSNCIVSVVDTLGNEFTFNEKLGEPGVYEGFIDKQYLQNGVKLKLYFELENGKEYASDFEELMPCPPIDSIYYEVQSLPTSDPDVNEDGFQFFIDLKAPEEYGRFFRWQIDETWEYHSDWPIKNYIDINGIYRSNTVTDFSLFTCYRTIPIDKIFILSTKGLGQNQFLKYPLHFVSDQTQRLLYKYSLLIKQYSLSESAYYFWENLKKNNQESGGFFDSQPALVKGNVHSINNPSEEVLGYFGLSSFHSKRIIISDVKELSFSYIPHCVPILIDGPLPGDRPLYFISAYDEGTANTSNKYYAGEECFDCTTLGGTTIKPDFWDEK